MIRVLHVLHVMNYAGTETLLINIYRNIDRNKIQFDFAVCDTNRGDYDEEIKSLGGKIIYYPRYRGTNHFTYQKWWNSFFKEHKEYCIVHGHIGSTAAIYLSIAKKFGCYTIAHSHATDSHIRSLKEKIYKLYSYPTRWIADYFMGCSMAALTDRYGKKIAENLSISKVFYNAIDTEKFIFDENTRRMVRHELGIESEKIVLGTVGRLTPAKNPFMIIDIILKLKKSGLNFVFLLFGRGEMEDAIVKKINDNHLEKYIMLEGVRNDINRMLQAMDIFIFPSVFEGLGITCIEAQMADLECFCSETIPEEAKITEKYIALPIDNSEIWVKCIQEKILNGMTQRRDRSLEIKNAGYDIKSQSNWIEKFYLEILGRIKNDNI